MKEETVRKHIQNASTPDKYSWAGLDRFPDGRNWKRWPRFGGAEKMRLSDLPIGTLIMRNVGKAIHKVVEQEDNGVVTELVDNQNDQFSDTIGSRSNLENSLPNKVNRPKYICLPEDT